MITDKKSILFVEPDQVVREVMRKTLEKSGYRVILAEDGEEALNALTDTFVDLIISALRMPGVDGVEFMEEIKRRNLAVPVIFLTAYGDVESYMDLMNMGAFDYLNKPTREREILRVTRNALRETGNAECVLNHTKPHSVTEVARE